MPSIVIVLLNYNSSRLTKKCIQSLFSTKDPKDEYHIVVWDNASKHAPKKDEFPHSELIHSKKNLGFAEGNNKAVAHALKTSKFKLQNSKNEPDYLLILNNDTRVTKGMVRQLIETFDSDPNVGIVVPKIYFEKGYEFHKADYQKHHLGRVIWYGGGGIDWPNLVLFHKGVDEVDRGQFDISYTLMKGKEKRVSTFATGCCMLTTPKIWNKLHGFDTKYFLYYEDADLSMRLQQNLKKSIIFEPKATLYHLNAGSSTGSGSQLHQYYQTRNRLRFGLCYASMRTKLALLNEARRLFFTGNQAVRLGILHALGGTWGNQHHRLKDIKASVPSS